PKFYIFTNDKEYAKTIVDAVLDSTEESLSYQFVEGNDESHACLDLVLMSKCKHHILANSSFSWWGEYLSDQSGITVAPSKWTNDSDNKDIYRNNWVVL
nr:alpha-1,2-fucosyltransferase [Lachnospiraceae bacterium]